MAVGFAAVIILKKAVRSLPVLGGVAKPLLGACLIVWWGGGCMAQGRAGIERVAGGGGLIKHTCTPESKQAGYACFRSLHASTRAM
jgi:hypothetical protein